MNRDDDSRIGGGKWFHSGVKSGRGKDQWWKVRHNAYEEEDSGEVRGGVYSG